jgi:hypothetical protein
VGAGPARERERSSRQDAREIFDGSTISVSGILPAGKAGLSLASKLPQGVVLKGRDAAVDRDGLAVHVGVGR